MPTKYITKKTAYLFKEADGRSREMALIYGDEVKTSGSVINGRARAEFRGRKGYIDADSLGTKPALEIYFIDVGQGDSTFIVTPNRKKILIDGGINKRAFGFLAWKYRFDKDGPPIDIDLLVLSHADGDHIRGLMPIIQHPKINVRKIIHNGIATFSSGSFATPLGNLDSDKHLLTTRHDSINDLPSSTLSEEFEAWKQVITAEITQYCAVDASMGQIDIGDPSITIDILGPIVDTYKGRPAFRWLGAADKTINGHSVVLRLNYGKVSALFPGDLNEGGSKKLMEDPVITSKLSSHIFKSPHHGSHDFYKPFLDAIKPQISIISSGDEPDHGHPRAIFIGAIGQASRSASPLVFSTEIAATFLEAGTKELEPEISLDTLDISLPDSSIQARKLFKRRLHGMINVRTNGNEMYSARRVAAGYWWESYGPMVAASE